MEDSAHISEDQPELDSQRKVQIGLPDAYLYTNLVLTARYKWWNFVPLVLLHQFRNVLNCYFLFIAFLQMIPQITTTNGTPTLMMPLAFVLVISMIREGYEDYLRHMQDKSSNARHTHRAAHRGQPSSASPSPGTLMGLRQLGRPNPRQGSRSHVPKPRQPKENYVCWERSEWYEVEWQTLQVGDIVKVQNGEEVPADLVLLEVPEEDGIAMVQTINLDGESNLKRRFVVPEIMMHQGELAGDITCEAPSKAMHSFCGTLQLSSMSDLVGLNIENLLMRGSTLKNTPYAVGVVVYAGYDTRVVMNSAEGRLKMSQMEVMTNKMVSALFLLQAIMVLVAGFVAGVVHAEISDFHWYLQDSGMPFWVGLQKLFTHLILLLGMIPISLVVTLEIAKFLQRFLMMTDLRMYHEENDQCFMPRTTSLNEELGQIDFIFSDKTGTLTQNSMDFKCCWVAGEAYGDYSSDVNRGLEVDGMATGLPHVAFGDPQFVEDLCDSPRKDVLHKFLLAMSLCHTVHVEFDPQKSRLNDGYQYQGESPDENAFVWAAAALGYQLRGKSSGVQQELRIRVNGSTKEAPKRQWLPTGSSLHCDTLKPIAEDEELRSSAELKTPMQLVDTVGYPPSPLELSRNTPPVPPPLELPGKIHEDSQEVLPPGQLAPMPGLASNDASESSVSPLSRTPLPSIGINKTMAAHSPSPSPLRLSPLPRIGSDDTNSSSLSPVRLPPLPNKLGGESVQPGLTLPLSGEAATSSNGLGAGTGSGASPLEGEAHLDVSDGASPPETEAEQPLRSAPPSIQPEAAPLTAQQHVDVLAEGEHRIDLSPGVVPSNGRRITLDYAASVDVEWKLLQTIDFSSSRARMSIIVQDTTTGRIELFTKGADGKMMELMDPDWAQAHKEDIVSCQNAVETYANSGLRTLLWGHRVLPPEEYQAWAAQYEDAGKALVGRVEKLEEVAALIEQKLELLAATAVEDLLQEGVPDTIQKLRTGAGIKIWVLTGDKQGTAINIAKSCRLIEDSMQVHVLNLQDIRSSDGNCKLSREQAAKMNAADCLVQIEQINAAIDSTDSAIQHCLVVDGGTLEVVFAVATGGAHQALWQSFQALSMRMESVVCCRVSPGMKAMVCQVVRDHHPARPVTLAIGDGANDVPMIQSAHVGIGIIGVEGRQAALASDYAIGQFRFLLPLLLVHGRWSYIRNTFIVNYSFYKNIAFAVAQYWWAFSTAFSGQKFFIEVGYQLFNIVYSGLPLLMYGLFEQDVNAWVSLKHAELYKLGRENGLLSSRVFAQWVIHGFYHSLVFYTIPRWSLNLGVFENGSPAASTWLFGGTIFGVSVLTVNGVIILHTRLWTWVQHISVILTCVVWWVSLIWWSAASIDFGTSFMGEYQMLHELYDQPVTWLTTLLAVVVGLIPSLLLYLWGQEPGGPSHGAYHLKSQGEHKVKSSITDCGCCCWFGPGYTDRSAPKLHTKSSE